LRQSHKTILLWLLLILMFVSIYQLFTGPSKAADEKIAFGSFMQEVQNNPAHIKKVTIKGEHWKGEYNDGHKFTTIGPATGPSLRKSDAFAAVPSDRPDLFTAKIVELLGDPTHCNGLGERGRALYERSYNWPTVISRLEALLEPNSPQ